MAYYARVKTEAPGNLKFEDLGERLGVNPMQAFGMAVAIWCLCWEFEFLDGRLKRFTAKSLARRLKWDGPPEKLLGALLDSTVLEQEADGTLVVHDFTEEQEGGIKILQRNRSRNAAPVPPATSTPPSGASGDDTVVRVLMQRMRECHITGSASQKREHAEAWKARGIAEKAEHVIMGEGKGLDIFSIAKMLNGGASKQTQPSTIDSLKKWAQEGDARDAAAAAAQKEKAKK